MPRKAEGEIEVSVLQAYPAASAQTASEPPAEAPVGPDHLAGGVLRSLSRSFRGHYSWGVVATLVIGFLSFGVLPLLRWTQNFHRYVRLERQQFWHLAEWVRIQTGHPDAATLPEEAEKLRWRGLLAATAWLWLAAVVAFFAIQLWDAPSPGHTLFSSTFGVRWRATSDVFRPDLFVAWTIGLFIAYALHWLGVQLHAGDVRRFIQKFNRVAQWEGVEPLSRPRVGFGAHPLWLLGALAMLMAGGIWGLPLMLAGAVQRRYISRTSALVRAEAADRVRTILLLRRPVLRVPQFARASILCRGERCRAPIPLPANFCTRCGARAGTVIGDVA